MDFSFRQISDDELSQFNQRGWIPGPLETETDYLKRIEALNHFFSYPPSDLDDFLTDGDWQQSRELTKQLFDFSIDWVVAHYSNKNLSFFEGAATWILQKQEVEIPLIQLKKAFIEKKLLNLYGKEEVLAHEAVHAARMAFDEPKFEEIFAYMTSPSFFRRNFGPLFQKSWEASLFLGSLLFSLLLLIGLFFWNSFETLGYLSFLIPGGLLSYYLIRLIRLRIQLNKCLNKLKSLISDSNKARAFLFRLTDREIGEFSQQSEEVIDDSIKQKAKHSLRWKLLVKVYEPIRNVE